MQRRTMRVNEAASGRRLLVIDDDAEILMTFELVLAAEGFAVETARDGAAAMSSIAASAPDLVILDISMPVKDGLETIKDLRKRIPGVKILAISGGGMYGMTDVIGIAKRIGADDVRVKPLDTEGLVTAVRGLIG